jgi:hypothetical protein
MRRNNPILAFTVLAATAITSPAPAQERPAPSPVDLSEITNAFLANAGTVVEHRNSAGAIDGWQVTAGSKLGKVHSTVTITIPQDENGLRPISAKEVAENRKALEESAARARAGDTRDTQFLGRTISEGTTVTQGVQLPSGEVTNQTVTLPNGAVSNYWTPWFLACANGMVAPPASGPACNLLTADTLPQGNPNVQIIVLEMGDNTVPLSGMTGPTILDDGRQYAKFYGIQQDNKLPDGTYGPNIIVQNADAVAPPGNTTTYSNNGQLGITNATEARLDLEAVMATNPNAARYIVLQYDPFYEEPDGSDAGFHAFDVATQIAQSSGLYTVISTSIAFGGSDGTADATGWYPGADEHFPTLPGVVYVAASGDTPGYPAYPCTSQYVVCAGGTQINVDKNNNYTGQSMWYNSPTSGSAAGVEPSEVTPAFQKSLISSFPAALPPGQGRLTPDISYNAINFSMVLGGHWLTGGGTSLSAPLAAGVISNIPLLSSSEITPREGLPQRGGTITTGGPSVKSAQSFPSTTEVLEAMYAALSGPNSSRFYKPQGTCGMQLVEGTPVALNAGPGYTPCAGVGTPLGLSGLALPLRSRPPIRR